MTHTQSTQKDMNQIEALEFLKGKDPLQKGSSKDKFAVPGDPDSIFMHFKPATSIFDIGHIPKTYARKGFHVFQAAITSYKIAQRAGIPTNFIEVVAPCVIRVHKVGIIRGNIPKGTRNFLVPAELIFRSRVMGNLLRKFQNGTANPEDYSLPPGIPKEGTLLPEMVQMFTTKLENVDREISQTDVLKMSGIDESIVRECWNMIKAIVREEEKHMAIAGFALGDGKFEFAIDPFGNPMVVDTFGTQDEDRPFLKEMYETQGQIIHCSKEFVRQEFIKMGYKARLDKARAKGLPTPLMPNLSDAFMREWESRYGLFAHEYAKTIL